MQATVACASAAAKSKRERKADAPRRTEAAQRTRGRTTLLIALLVSLGLLAVGCADPMLLICGPPLGRTSPCRLIVEACRLQLGSSSPGCAC
jgi:hypothetical protein